MAGAATVVVTGAAGFIGRAACAALEARGCAVRGLVRALDAGTAARARFVPAGDLETIDDRRLAGLMHGATHVVHLAARVHQPDADGEGARAAMRRVNVDATARLARAAADAGAAHFVFASTIKVNGEATLPGRPFRESDPPDPHGDYATSKRDAELALAELAEATGLRVTSLRLPLTYGPGAKANFAALSRAVRAGVPLPFAAIDNRRSLLGVGNFGAALAALVASDDAHDRGRNTRYLLADAQPVSTPELVRAIAHALGVAPRLFAFPQALLRFGGACAGRAAAVERLVGSLEADTTAFRGRFAWTPPFTLAEELADAFAPGAPL